MRTRIKFQISKTLNAEESYFNHRRRREHREKINYVLTTKTQNTQKRNKNLLRKAPEPLTYILEPQKTLAYKDLTAKYIINFDFKTQNKLIIVFCVFCVFVVKDFCSYGLKEL